MPAEPSSDSGNGRSASRPRIVRAGAVGFCVRVRRAGVVRRSCGPDACAGVRAPRLGWRGAIENVTRTGERLRAVARSGGNAVQHASDERAGARVVCAKHAPVVPPRVETIRAAGASPRILARVAREGIFAHGCRRGRTMRRGRRRRTPGSDLGFAGILLVVPNLPEVAPGASRHALAGFLSALPPAPRPRSLSRRPRRRARTSACRTRRSRP